jgi:predicted acyltransferase
MFKSAVSNRIWCSSDVAGSMGPFSASAFCCSVLSRSKKKKLDVFNLKFQLNILILFIFEILILFIFEIGVVQSSPMHILTMRFK